MENRLEDLFFEVIEQCVEKQSSFSKIFICPVNVYNHILSLSEIGKLPVKQIADENFFEEYTFCRINDSSFYVVNLKGFNNDERGRLLIRCKDWYYSGENRFSSKAYIAFLDAHYHDFNAQSLNSQKLIQIELEMGEEPYLREILDGLKRIRL